MALIWNSKWPPGPIIYSVGPRFLTFSCQKMQSALNCYFWETNNCSTKNLLAEPKTGSVELLVLNYTSTVTIKGVYLTNILTPPHILCAFPSVGTWSLVLPLFFFFFFYSYFKFLSDRDIFVCFALLFCFNHMNVSTIHCHYYFMRLRM